MVQMCFATDITKQDNKQLVLSWLENDFKEKHQPLSHFWHNQSMIVDAFDDCRGTVVIDDHQQLIAYMVWSFYADKAGAEIDIVEVSESYRDQGIFKKILLAFSNRFPELAVLSVSALPQAQPVFEKMGWQRATRSTTLQVNSDRVFFKILKTHIPLSYTLPSGIAIAICSEDFYQVKTNPKNYADRTYYLTPTTDHKYNLTQPIVGACHKDGYIGFYFNQQLIHACKPKHLTDLVDNHHAIIVLKKFPEDILQYFLANVFSTEVQNNEEEEETTPARKMLRGQNSSRIKKQISSQQTVLFENPPEEVGNLSANEIHQAITKFCQQNEYYDGQSPLEATQSLRYPLIFFLLESYKHENYSTVTDKLTLSESIKIVIDRYPNARNLVFEGQDPFSYCAYHSLCDLLKVLEPSATELANKNLYCTTIGIALGIEK